MSRVHLMCKAFPTFQSYLPTGANYMREIPMEARVFLVEAQAKILIRAASLAGCHHTGALDRLPVIDELTMLRRLTEEGCNRNDKKAWKRLAKAEGLWSGVDEWYDGTKSDAVKDKQEWIAFREAVTTYLRKRHDELKEAECL